MATVARDGHSVLTGRRALIVNDSADGVETLGELLELCGYEVSVAWNVSPLATRCLTLT